MSKRDESVHVPEIVQALEDALKKMYKIGWSDGNSYANDDDIGPYESLEQELRWNLHKIQTVLLDKLQQKEAA